MDQPKPVCPPGSRRFWLRELRVVCLHGVRKFLPRIGVLALTVWLGVLAVWLQHGQDQAWLKHLRSDNDTVNAIAQSASFWGGWLGWVAVGVLIWVWGAARRRRNWRKAGLACLLATLLAGLTINCFRPTMGRPRPYTELPDGFYGSSLDPRYHAFMSGHTAGAFAAATALVMTLPPIGVPALAGAVVVSWSRMQLNKHHPTDLLTGGVVGILWGWCFGRAGRRANASAARRRHKDADISRPRSNPSATGR